MNIIFGPVNSRRFGVSLGIDLSPSRKQCNFDCLYCELAPSATVDHQSNAIAVNEIITALTAALSQHKHIDVITLTANGEPTLYPDLDALIEAINPVKKERKTLILTNSATLTEETTFETLLKLDQVKLSLDAITPEVFKKIDRPHEKIEVSDILKATKAFSETFKGELFIEILFVQGLNDTSKEIKALNDALLQITTARIDIGTIDRPPAYPVEGLTYAQLHHIAMQFDASLPIHIASRHTTEALMSDYSEGEIINTLDKRPLSRDDIDLLFNDASQKRLKALIDKGTIIESERSGITFYIPEQNAYRKRQKS